MYIFLAYHLIVDYHELSKVEEIVCYGIGKISDSVIAQYQVAVLLLLMERLLTDVSSLKVTVIFVGTQILAKKKNAKFSTCKIKNILI